MKRYIIGGLALVLILTLTACGIQTGNRVVAGKDIQTFNYCYVMLDGQEITKGFVTQWRDYENSDEIQVLVNGKYYLTHYSNVVLVADPSIAPLAYSNPDVWGGEE